MPDYYYRPGFSVGANGTTTRKDVPIAVSNGAMAVSMPAVTGTDRSIVAGVAAQVLMPANTARMGLYIRNDTASDIWFNIGAVAVAAAGGGNMKLAANGGYYESGSFTPTEAISIIAASGTPAITAREF